MSEGGASLPLSACEIVAAFDAKNLPMDRKLFMVSVVSDLTASELKVAVRRRDTA